ILAVIDTSLTVNIVILETKNGSSRIERGDNPPEEIIYPDVPEVLATLPRDSISMLLECPRQIYHFRVTLVTLENDAQATWYAFKRYMRPSEEQSVDLLLEEITVRVEDPAEAGDSSQTRDLTVDEGDNFNDALEDEGPTDPRQVTLASKLSSVTTTTSGLAHVAGGSFTCKLSWPLKLTWAIEATSGVVDLHASGGAGCDIKIENILLGRDGRLKLIDVAPQIGITERYAAPDAYKTWSKNLENPPLFEAPTDVFALGLVLWQITEEVSRFERPWQELQNSPRVVWGTRPDGTPQWYRDLVESCLEDNPKNRPTAKEILDVLKSAHD
ncbi:hypothetical protein H0H81_004768, partial [Sphagnurus paluster]